MSAIESFVLFLKNLEHQWDAFKKIENGTDEKNLRADFSELISLTLDSCLDFRNVQQNPQIDEIWEKIKITISSLSLEEGANQSINNVLNTDKWNSNYGQWLLSGKLIGSSVRLVTFDNKLLHESDDVINARLESLMNLFLKTTNDDTGQMILNVFETYRKYIIRDVMFQCKLSCETVKKLINYYMIILCHRKCSDHISSTIKLFPNYRKISYVLSLCKEHEDGVKHSKLIKYYKIKIVERFIEDLLHCEFQKIKLEQDIKNFNLYIQQLIDLAYHEKTIDENMERILLSASDMNVISDYYYLAATQLRLQMPNKQNLIYKLISIGISHDISSLQELKYSIDETKTSEGLENEYKLAYRRIYLALVTLGCTIKDYALRRLCFQTASFCEHKTTSCVEILRHLPVLETVDQGDNLDPILLDIRYLLETFQYDIRDRTKLSTTFEKYSNASFETLEYYGRTAELRRDLAPLEYPGVEKYMKRQAIEEKEHISQTSDLDKCLTEIAEFNNELAGRFKNLRNQYTPLRKQKLPTDEQIDQKVKEILSKSDDFRITKSGDIFYELCCITFEDILSPTVHLENLKYKHNEMNRDNLHFSYEMCSFTKDDIDINSIYSSGIVQVYNLYDKGYSTYDIENIMLYTILEKKMKFIAEEFALFNKNRNLEFDEEQQNQVHACFLYLSNKPHPEYGRLLRLSSTLRRYNSPMEYNLDFYVFDAMPGRYKYRHKNKPLKVKQENNEGFENGNGDLNNSMKDNSFELDHLNLPIPVSDIKLESTMQQIPQIQQIMRVKKEKIPPAINLTGIHTFNTSKEIQSIFNILQIEIAALIQKEVFIDISKISDISSPHLIQCINNEVKSSLPIKIQKIRNGNLNPREIDREIKMPLNVSGRLTIVLEFRDEIKYDEHFENPYIASSLHHRIMSNLMIDHLTHNAKCDIDCIVDGFVSKIRCSFQGQKTYRPRKKVQKPDINPMTAEQISVIQAPPKVEIIGQSSSNNVPSISNIVMNVNNNINSTPVDPMHNGMNYVPHQNIQQPYPYPQIDSNQFIVPVSQQYSTIQTQYTPSVCYAQSNDNISTMTPIHSSVIQAPQQFTNGATVQQQQIPPQFQQQPPQQSVLQGQEPFICNSNAPVPPDSNTALVSQNRVKPKVEILKIEDVSDINLTGLKKISFSNPCIVVKEEPPNNGFNQVDPGVSVVTIEKPIKPEIKVEDELVDFEDEIQTTMLQSTVPKKHIHIPETKSLPNISLPKSPPPLHYPSNKSEANILVSKEIKKEPTTQQTVSPQIRPNVIKSPLTSPKIHAQQIVDAKPEIPKEVDNFRKMKIDLTKNFAELIENAKKKLAEKQKEAAEVVIDLTEDISEPSIDLTSDIYDDRRLKMAKKSTPDITFIGCDTVPVKSNRIIDSDDDVLRDSKERARKRLLKRSWPISQSEDNIRNCKVLLVDVMKDMDKSFLKKDTPIRLQKIPLNHPIIENALFKNNLKSSTVVKEIPTEELPNENYVDSAYDATFTIVCHNSSNPPNQANGFN
ncbi:uncharacterized protein [Chironomus tepperi]|uniref:uncharacterized protein n=1 Tax=Chironomus tepperi TaxID=113505 RepID=UPI00391EFFA9